MKAIRVDVFGGPEVLRLVDLPEPVPGPGEVVVRVRAAGVNPVEAYQRAGLGSAPELPFTPGSDAGGVVHAVGSGVSDWQPGARVYTSGSLTGTYAQFALCGAEQVHHLPANLSFAQGAALGVPYATAYRALFQRGRAVPGETLLVHGASGGVGLAAVQLAAAQNLTVIGTASTEAGRRLVLAQGAAHALDHSSPTHGDELLQLTDGRGVDLIIEMLSNVNLGRDLQLLAPRGRVVCVGNRGTANEGEVSINARDLMRREADILGVMLPLAPAGEHAAIHEALATGLATGVWRPIVSRELRLAEAPTAHRALLEGHSLGKIVLLP